MWQYFPQTKHTIRTRETQTELATVAKCWTWLLDNHNVKSSSSGPEEAAENRLGPLMYLFPLEINENLRYTNRAQNFH